jgi:putative ABC transport system ATP-binding protein
MDRGAEDGADGAHARPGGEPPALSPGSGRNRLSETLFELDGVAAERGGRVVLRDVDVAIDRGVTAVVGPSGSGKSTLLRLLNRLADPESGSVRFDGEDVRTLDVLQLRRRAVLVPQLPAPLPGTVAENVEYGPSLCGRTAEVDRCLTLAGLDASYAARDASRLSVGEQQRLMLARAIALDPEALLLDEPTAALDEAARDGVEQTLFDLHERLGVALVLVTHDRAQARRLATRTIELRDGRVDG